MLTSLATVGVCALALASPPVEQPTAPRETFDRFSGTCADFNDHVKNRGLRDPEGNTHQNTLGWTLCKFSGAMPGPSFEAKRSIEGASACLGVDAKPAQFESEEIVILMRWDHGRPSLSASCRDELANTEAAIRDHEADHVRDCRAILAESRKRWAADGARALKACEPAKGDPNEVTKRLMARLQQKVRDEIRAELERMNRDMEYRTRDTHERIGYGTFGINCGKCAE